MLKVDGIDVFYGDLQVLWEVSFDVKQKEILVLVGANGAGKSTTIRTISSLLTPRKGSVEFDGIRLDKTPPYHVIEHGVVQVPEGRRLFPQMSVEENLIMGTLYGEAKAKRAQTMERVYGLFPRLGERRKQLAGTLSGGEQQMLATSPPSDSRLFLCRISSASFARSMKRGSRFYSLSRTCGRPCPCATAPTCSKMDASFSKARARR
jgi:ABC-type branched-subunit amino acid transport system ATPase component